jgi:hypothetical protein
LLFCARLLGEHVRNALNLCICNPLPIASNPLFFLLIAVFHSKAASARLLQSVARVGNRFSKDAEELMEQASRFFTLLLDIMGPIRLGSRQDNA